MGTSCAPPYTTLYLGGGWERLVFSDDVLSMYLCHVLPWHRYIDYIFIVWDSPRPLLDEFIQALAIN